MNKKHLLVVIVVIFSIKLNSQAAILAMIFGDKVASEKFNLSLELGGTWSSYADLEDSKKSQSGINFGIAGNLKLSENWFLSPNAFFLARRNTVLNNYSLNSGDLILDTKFANVQTDVQLNYIDVPIFISYQTNNKKYRFGLAPQVSFLQKSTATFHSPEGKFEQKFNAFTNKTDYGVIADIGYILGKAHKGKGVHLHFRYYFGFTDIFKDAVSAANNKSNFFSFHLSLPFITDELAKKNLEDYE